MTFKVEIKTTKGVTCEWVNGGIGYTENELVRVEKKIKNDPRIVEYKIIPYRL